MTELESEISNTSTIDLLTNLLNNTTDKCNEQELIRLTNLLNNTIETNLLDSTVDNKDMNIDHITLNIIGPNIELDKLDKDYINFHAMLNNHKSLKSTYTFDSNNKITCNDGNNFQM